MEVFSDNCRALNQLFHLVTFLVGLLWIGGGVGGLINATSHLAVTEAKSGSLYQNSIKNTEKDRNLTFVVCSEIREPQMSANTCLQTLSHCGVLTL